MNSSYPTRRRRQHTLEFKQELVAHCQLEVYAYFNSRSQADHTHM